MIKKPFNIPRPGGRAPRLRPAAPPDWYKHFLQTARLAGKTFKLKQGPR